jgi:addiction module HigA family antidote
MGITMYRVARDTGMPADRVGKLVRGERSITADTALRLARFFGTSASFWMNLQARYDLDKASDEIGAAIQSRVTPWAGSATAQWAPGGASSLNPAPDRADSRVDSGARPPSAPRTRRRQRP